MNSKVDQFLENTTRWKSEMTLLRKIILEQSELNEDYKWMHPCYTFNGKNVVLSHGFKDYCALLFHKGSLMKDSKGILIQQTENVQAARQIRFTNIQQIKDLKPVIIEYINEAIDIERSGKKVAFKKTADFEIPVEFRKELEKNSNLKKAFSSLTPGRQKGYLFYFTQAKQSKTRESRIQKYIPNILQGKGIDD